MSAKAVTAGLFILVVVGATVRMVRGGGWVAAGTYAREIGFELPTGTVGAIRRRLALREIAGAACGAATAWPALLVTRVDDPQIAAAVVLATFVLGYVVGLALLAVREAFRRVEADGPAQARAVTPTYADYVPGYERTGARVMAVVSVLLAIGLMVVNRSGRVEFGPWRWLLVVFAVAAPLLAVAVDRMAATRLLVRGQVADSRIELAWDDAMRARSLRDLTAGVLAVCAYAPLVLLSTLSGVLVGSRLRDLMDCLVVLMVVALFVVTFAGVVLDAKGHVRRRLWATPPVAELVTEERP